MTRDNPNPGHTHRRTILQALGGLTVTGALASTSAASSGTSTDQIGFEEMDAESKTIFKQLLSGKDVTKQGSQLPTDLLLYDQVRYDQSVYRIQRVYSKESRYHVTFDKTSRDAVAEQVNNQIGATADTAEQHIKAEGKITKRDLSTPAKQSLTLERDRTSVKELPSEFIENTFLEVNETIYRILAGHADVAVVTFAAINNQ